MTPVGIDAHDRECGRRRLRAQGRLPDDVDRRLLPAVALTLAVSTAVQLVPRSSSAVLQRINMWRMLTCQLTVGIFHTGEWSQAHRKVGEVLKTVRTLLWHPRFAGRVNAATPFDHGWCNPHLAFERTDLDRAAHFLTFLEFFPSCQDANSEDQIVTTRNWMQSYRPTRAH